MKLQSIEIRRLPGIDRGFVIDALDPAVNFVTGPNASGKSSLIRALRHLLAGHRPGDPHLLSLTAGFHDGRHLWTVDRNGAHVAWQCDGRPAEPPAPPPADLLDSYLIGVEDLVQIQGSGEQALARQLRRELNGGLDLPALRDELFPHAPRAGHRERQALERARQQREEVEREQRQAAAGEQRLPELDREIAQAMEAQEEQQALETALRLLDTEQALRGTAARLEDFPPDMERLTGREPERLAALDRRREHAREELARTEQARRQAAERLTRTGLENARPDPAELERLRGRLEALHQQERALADADTACTDARTARDRALARLDGREDSARELPQLDDASLDRAHDLARRRRELEDRRTALETRVQGAPESSPEEELERHERGARLLYDWLALPSPDHRERPVLPTVLGAGLGAIIAVFGGLVGPGWLAVVGGGVMLLALLPLRFPGMVSGILPERLRRSAEALAADARRDQLTREFTALGLDKAPDAPWVPAGVRACLEAIERRRDTLRLDRQRFEEARTLRSERDSVDRQLQELEQEEAAFAREAGFDPTLAGRLDDFLQRTRELQQAELALQQAEARRADTAGRVRALSTELREALARWPGTKTDAAPDASPAHVDLAPAVAALRQRADEAAEAEREAAEKEREARRLRDTLEEIEQETARELAEVGLGPDQRGILKQRLEQHEAWHELRDQREEQRRRRDDLARELVARPDLLALAGTQDSPGERDTLARRHTEAVDRAARLEELREERSQIRERIRQTGLKGERERAMAAEQGAREALEQHRARALESTAGRFLLDDIQDEFRREEEPELLRRAREAFARFTHHQWALRLSDEDDGFLGEDRVQGALRTPGELSTATRMQLLLALRLARVETREAGDGSRRWPLLIDEALATTDPERAGVMFRTLRELAQDRQILYLAASDYEVQLWQQATGESPHRVDLQAVRGIAMDKSGEGSGRTPARFRLPAAPTIPEPGDRDIASWARELGVLRPDPTAPAEEVHLLHVLFDDPATARSLMQDWRVDRVGPLRSLLDSRIAARALPETRRRTALAHRSMALEHWLDACRIGHGQPVNRGILEQAHADGVLTDNTLEGVVRRAEETGGDPVELLEGLRQDPITMASGTEQRLRTRQREQLESWLKEHGLLDERDPLTPEQRRQYVLERVPADADPGDIQRLIDHLEHETGD
ncbi:MULTISPECIES: hypothetical protein [unclassified Thioalkalivibrio]|uniref:hypothetical protein n=1 Tax=unclassified Thioalkalivibrio TaxID=2621013 RepID=UPI00037B9EAC|nr:MULTISPECIES: hypothetical protein [unclassified Thioalkalivibrio]